MDHSGHVSMKNAAKCDSWREMQKSLNVKISNSNGTESLCSQYVRLNAGKLLKPNGFCYLSFAMVSLLVPVSMED